MAPSRWRGGEQQLVDYALCAGRSANVRHPLPQQEAQMRGVLTALVAKSPSAGLSARNRDSERGIKEKKLPDVRRRWTKSKEAYPLLRATRTGRQDSAATPHEATHS